MKQNLLVLSALALVATLGHEAVAQSSSGIFEDKFDEGPAADPNQRYKNDYARKGTNSFIYAHAAMEYPAPLPAGAWTGVLAQWQTTAKDLENNHYAVVSPANIYSSVGAGYTPYYNSWPNLVASGVDADGNANGGVLAVNAGTTPGILYERQVVLERGKYYKLTYDLWVENGPVRLKTNLLSSDGTIGLGTALGQAYGNNRVWAEQVQYFFLPATECEDDTYTFNLQNHQLANNGNDFAIDNIVLVEITDAAEILLAEAAVNRVDAPCTESAAVPTANDDTHSYDFSTQTVRFPLLSNDAKGDGSPIYTHSGAWDASVNAANAKLFDFEFVVPSGEGHTGDEVVSIDGENLAKGSTLTIQGEGTWKFTYNNSWSEFEGIPGNTFYIEFIPEAGFIGNPSPVEYIIREYATVDDAENQNGLTSASATVTVTFELPVDPVAVDDIQLTPNGTGEDAGKYIVNPFANDMVDETLLDPSAYPTLIEVAHPLNEGAIYSTASGSLNPIVVPGEGEWIYTTGTGFVFTPEVGFVGTPAPLYYRFQEPTNSVWSNWAGIGLGPNGEDVLPVIFTDFYAVKKNQSVELIWSTAGEINNAGFEIHKSTDGKSWHTIGFVSTLTADGNSAVATRYTYTDDQPVQGINIYRLKQVDQDGGYNYSSIASVSYSVQTAVNIYPNPATDHVFVSGLSAGQKLQVINVSGQVVSTYVVTGTEQRVNIAGLSEGMYYIQVIRSEGTSEVSKLIISR